MRHRKLFSVNMTDENQARARISSACVYKMAGQFLVFSASRRAISTVAMMSLASAVSPPASAIR
jgi:hypothetical protein